MRPSEIGQLDALLNSPPRTPPPRTPPSRGGVRDGSRSWLLRGLGLLGVAVVSGLVWLVVMPKDDPKPTPSPTSAPVGEFAFERAPQVPEALKDSQCAAHAYGETKTFLTSTPCQQLTRGLFTTKTPDGRTVYTSVSVVRMKTIADANKLKDLTTRDGTGNVNDLVRDGAVQVPGLRSLGSGGFAARQQDRDVIIIESDAAQRSPTEEEHVALMKRISADAFRLVPELG
ncbi:hypothetical protein [Saccharothrix australiensis]|uniref:Uncharacterized protein n=1 Tax=Saccharothrix australiensis TaxID=2072 RepID=A0A495W799_9PSEU|nr:hypothetical protein [Saccharothrix australiensis]RKT56960.1 hypothetical protein C8E97_5674 [Saccharothrix australiensis]